MSQVCDICGKRPLYGHNVSHSHKKTLRRWEPSLRKIRIEDKRKIKVVKVCNKCVKAGKIKRAL
jgi:large subunit ribosomal protein L28